MKIFKFIYIIFLSTLLAVGFLKLAGLPLIQPLVLIG
ncbi:hypothetical protein EDB31_13159 [Vibrio crassostreae]|nr:hypothetical protein EDB31_13159 [Vibrio crassostreae]